jgi:hypothetical protein
VPARRLASLVLESEGVDALALLDGVLAISVASVDGGVDGIKGGRGREVVCEALLESGWCLRRWDHGSACLAPRLGMDGIYGPFLRDMVAVGVVECEMRVKR